MSSFRYFEQIFKITFRYNLMSVFQIFVLPIIIRAEKSWTKNKRCNPHTVLWIWKGTRRVAYDALTGNAPWWWSVQKNDLSRQQKITSRRSYFQHLDPHFTWLAWGDKETVQKDLKDSTQNIVEPTYNKNENSIRNYSRTFGKHFVKISKWGHRLEKCTLKSEQHVLCK